MLIGTHHGKFHADDVFALAILKQLYPTADVLRSRDLQRLAECDIIVDVGGGKYDHHTTDKVYRENGIPYASAGLIWRDFGEKVIEKYGAIDQISSLIRTIDEKLIQAIDADDNGVQLDKDWRIKSISDVVEGFNPAWNSDGDEDEAFHTAVAFAGKILMNHIGSEISRLDAVEVVENAYRNREQKDLLVLRQFCPWTETLLSVDMKEEVLFVVYPDSTSGYRVQVVPQVAGSFQARKKLPEAWAGKTDDELGRLVGIPDAVFCHPARFIAGATSLESALKMARQAISEN